MLISQMASMAVHAAAGRLALLAGRTLAVAALGLTSLGAGGSSAQAQAACVAGGAKAGPYDQAVQHTRKAAEAVLSRGGAESCLRGKLTNALLGLSASCEAAGQSNSLCQLADQAVVQLNWTLPFMDSTSQRVLDLSAASNPAPADAGAP